MNQTVIEWFYSTSEIINKYFLNLYQSDVQNINFEWCPKYLENMLNV